MKRFYFCIFLFLLFFASSCKKNSDSLSYDTFDSLPTVSLEDVFEPITFIPLQSNDSSIVSNVLKVCMSEDRFTSCLLIHTKSANLIETGTSFLISHGKEDLKENIWFYLTFITVIQKRCFTLTMLSRVLSNIKLMVHMIPPYL